MEEEEPNNIEQEEEESIESEEDENGELINDGVESKFLSVLAKIHMKDPQIYNVKSSIFQGIYRTYAEEDFESKQPNHPAQKGDKKLTYKDMERQRILSKSSKQRQAMKEEPIDQQQQPDPTPYQLEQKLKSDFKKVAQRTDNGESNEDDFLKMKPKKATKKEQPNEVLRKMAKDEHEHEILEKYWGDDTKLNETDLFLKRYILSKGWVDVSGEAGKKKVGKKVLKEDDERSQQMEDFEERYNFRFEEPGGTNLQTFPRQIEESMRLKKETRKEKRVRKEQQKRKQLEEELRKAEKEKAKKKKQIEARIAEIQEGKDQPTIQIEEPEEQEPEQATWFYCDDCQRGLAEGELYYVCGECTDYTLCRQCHDLIIHKHPLEEQIVPDGCGAPSEQEVRKTLSELLKCRKCKKMIDEYSKRYELIDPNDGFTYNYCEECQDLLPLSLRKKCKQQKPQKVKLDELLTNEPDKLKQYVQDDELDRLLKEYMGMDYDKIVADGLRTKFKYIDVKPQSYGLSDQQLLYSDDKELNKYVSIKKLAPYRQENLKLRNSIYNKKIKSISRSAKLNRKRVQADEAGDPTKLAKRKLQLLRERAERRKQNSIEKVQRLRLLNLSTKEMEVKHFLPKSRLESYGLE